MVNSHLNFEELYFKYFYCSDNPVCTKIAFNMNEVNNNLTCDICKKKFSRVWVKNRHLKDIHHVEEKKSESRKAVHMKCPICPEEEKKPFDSHGILSTHLEEIHSISIKTSLLNFRNEEEFEAWRATDNRTANYTKRLSKNTKNGLLVYYECNRSYFSGYTSQCSKRNMKTGGSIKISGFCPSRIHAKFSSAGVSVKYVETHVGHKDELRSKHLSKKQQEIIAGKLMSGVTKEKILEDARILTNDKLERINVLTRGDLDYIIRKFNINKRKHDDDMIAIESKVRREVHSKAESGVAEKVLCLETGKFKVPSAFFEMIQERFCGAIMLGWGETINFQENVRNLALIMDMDLKFSKHILICLNKAYLRLKLLYQCQKYLNSNNKKILCDSLVLSHLNFCDVVYSLCLTVVDEKQPGFTEFMFEDHS